MKKTTIIFFGLAMFIMAVMNFYSVWHHHSWFTYLRECIFSFGGIVLYLFPDVASEYSSHQGWTSNQIRQDPEWIMRPCGFALVVIAFYIIWPV